MTGALHSRLLQASAAAALVVIILGLGYLGMRGQPIAAARDLSGKKIGVTFGTSGSYFLWAYLIKHKLAPESITLVDLPPGRLVGALVNGNVDAVATWQPFTFEAQAALGKNALFLTEADAYKTTFAAVGPNEFLKGHASAIEKLVRAMLKAEQFMRSAATSGPASFRW